jgi:hypothetical protein
MAHNNGAQQWRTTMAYNDDAQRWRATMAATMAYNDDAQRWRTTMIINNDILIQNITQGLQAQMILCFATTLSLPHIYNISFQFIACDQINPFSVPNIVHKK